MRLAFAVAVHVDPEVLLVDEVLAVGDEPFQRKCMERIRQFQREGRTIVFVTHALDLVRQLCDRAILLDHGLVLIDGSSIAAVRTFRERFESEPEHDDDYGNGTAKITEVRVLDGAGRSSGRFSPGDALAIEFVVSSADGHAVSDWAVGIALEDHLDNVIYGTNTVMQGITLPPLTVPRQVRFSFSDIPMLEGQYFVTVAVHDTAGGSTYHRLDRRSSFRVVSEGTEVGILHLAPKIGIS